LYPVVILSAGHKALASQLAEAIKAEDSRTIRKGSIFLQATVQEHSMAFI